MSDDGLIRMSFSDLQKIRLLHLISGLDEDTPADTACCAVPTLITGYTEWVTEGRAAVTLGWDWKMLAASRKVALLRVGEPRSNVMLLDAAQHDLGHVKTSTLLEAFIDGFGWQDSALEHLNTRYAAHIPDAPRPQSGEHGR